MCTGKLSFWGKFSCEHLLLVLTLNFIGVIISLAFVAYVITYIFRRIQNREAKFFNKRLFLYFLGVMIALAIAMYLSLGI